MLADPMYGGNKNMIGWRWVGFPGDPMRRGDPYANWIFTDKPYPYEHRPLPMKMVARHGFHGRQLMAKTHPKVDAVIIGVGWVGGIIAHELTKAGLKVVGLERGVKRGTSNFQDDHDELAYAIRNELFQDTSKETWTLRHNLRETALPIRQLGSFLPGTGLGGAGVHWNGQTWRFHPRDFTIKTSTIERYGAAAIPAGMTIQDWGVTYDEHRAVLQHVREDGRHRRQGRQPQGPDHPGRQRLRGPALGGVPGQAAARLARRRAAARRRGRARLPPVPRDRRRTSRRPTRTRTA